MLKAAAIASYQHALHAVFVVCIVLSVVQFLAVLGIREISMETPPAAKVADEEEES